MIACQTVLIAINANQSFCYLNILRPPPKMPENMSKKKRKKKTFRAIMKFTVNETRLTFVSRDQIFSASCKPGREYGIFHSNISVIFVTEKVQMAKANHEGKSLITETRMPDTYTRLAEIVRSVRSFQNYYRTVISFVHSRPHCHSEPVLTGTAFVFESIFE